VASAGGVSVKLSASVVPMAFAVAKTPVLLVER
jgi:hypothetical protein